MSRQHLGNLGAALLFLGFVVAAVVATRSTAGEDAARRRRVSLFLLVALGASFPPGLLQKMRWPFATWHLIAARMDPVLQYPRIILVDSLGGEHNIDYRAWEPLIFMEIRHWVWWDLPRLDTARQREAAAFLLARANAARERARAGGPVGTRGRWLGPLAAPAFLLHPPLWSDPSRIPPLPFVRLRLYVDVWNLEERARGAGVVQPVLLYDSGASP